VTNRVLFSSKSVEWATPPALFASLDRLFHFQLDAAATVENAKCKKFFTKEDDGLQQNWGKKRVFCNPPYGRGIGKWVCKCFEASQGGALVVALLPSRTETVWFQDWIKDRAEVHFLKGRLMFGNGPYNAPFPSMIVIYGRRDKRRLITCQQCGILFHAERSDAKTCSMACRKALSRSQVAP
jgi:phage N-6-adenine-methyltransferase